MRMAIPFTHLHVHSHYSLLDGLSKIDDLLDRVKELGMNALALTDHGNMYAAVEFFKKAKAKGIKPIIGCEVYVAFEGMGDKRPGIDDTIYHMGLLVKNETGYKNLVKLVTRAHLEGFYYKPRIDEALLSQYADGLIGLSGCLAGKISRLILSNRYEEALALARRYAALFGKGNFYLEIQHHPNIPEQARVNESVLAIAKELGIPVVATCDSHYLRKEDAEAQDVLMLINTGAKSDDADRLTLKGDDFSLKSSEEMAKAFSGIPEVLDNTNIIAEACQFEFQLGKIKLPPFPVPDGKTPNEYLREICEQGLAAITVENRAEYEDRLTYELKIIGQTGYATYFLIVHDFVKWAKERHIVVGPGRGSAGGSLAAYVLNITAIDPIRYTLLFERFLNPERVSMPDIDLDFADNRRDEVIRYVEDRYGTNHVSQIITFGTMASRAVIRDVGRALGYEYSYCDRVAKMIPQGLSLDECVKQVDEFKALYKSDERARRLVDIARKLEGVARHASTHACGVVISADPLDDLVPLQHPSQGDQTIITQYEMHGVEDLGLLKMDFLGLKNLTVIEDTLHRIYAIHGKNIDLRSLALDDPKVYAVLQRGDTTGVFQLESEGMRKYLRGLRPTEFEDIVAMVALYRPGPMELLPEYIARKHGKKNIEYLHPKLQPILKDTQGICIYQEQLMRIARDLAGFSMGEADVLRKAVGKKIVALLVEQQEKLVSRMVANGISLQVAKKIWEWILPFASYGFNRSHAAAYALVSYQTAWLKANFPLEFMSALLTGERNDVERIAFLIEETRKMRIEVLAPDVNESFSHFSVVPGKRQIRFGLLAIKNVGEGIVDSIIKERKAKGAYLSIQDFISRVATKDLNKKSMESLIKAGTFDVFAERNQLLSNLDHLLRIAREHQKMENSAQKSLFGGGNGDSAKEAFVPSLTLAPTDPAQEREKLSWEKELLGLYVSSHPLRRVKNIVEARAIPISRITKSQGSEQVPQNPYQFSRNNGRTRIAGVVSVAKKIVTKNGKTMFFVKLEDLTDSIEVVVFPNLLEKNPLLFQEGKILFVGGRPDVRFGEKKFIAEEVEELIET